MNPGSLRHGAQTGSPLRRGRRRPGLAGHRRPGRVGPPMEHPQAPGSRASTACPERGLWPAASGAGSRRALRRTPTRFIERLFVWESTARWSSWRRAASNRTPDKLLAAAERDGALPRFCGTPPSRPSSTPSSRERIIGIGKFAQGCAGLALPGRRPPHRHRPAPVPRQPHRQPGLGLPGRRRSSRSLGVLDQTRPRGRGGGQDPPSSGQPNSSSLSSETQGRPRPPPRGSPSPTTGSGGSRRTAPSGRRTRSCVTPAKRQGRQRPAVADR